MVSQQPLDGLPCHFVYDPQRMNPDDFVEPDEFCSSAIMRFKCMFFFKDYLRSLYYLIEQLENDRKGGRESKDDT